MPKLIQNISGEILNNFVGEVRLVKPLVGQIQMEDYVNINGLICYLQNLTRAEMTSAVNKPMMFGLPKINNTTQVDLEISY